MTNVLNGLRDVIGFLFEELGSIASFFTTNNLGIIILGVALFCIVVSVILSIVK